MSDGSAFCTCFLQYLPSASDELSSFGVLLRARKKLKSSKISEEFPCFMENIIFDAHLDLSMNAMEWNRDLTRPLDEIREREKGQKDKPDRGNSLVNFEGLRKANIGVVVATQIARYVAPQNALPGWHSPEQAWAHTQAQLAWYRTMEARGELTPITNLETLERQIDQWSNAHDHARQAVGYILSLEGADSLITIDYLERAYRDGLRAVGPAHYGPGRYAHGTDANGGLGSEGRVLLKEMEKLNIILDLTHLCDESFWEALKHFHGPLWASHSNCRTLVPHHRQFSDDQIKALVERGAVIGAVMDASMIVPGWIHGVTTPESANCRLTALIDHMDHICQVAGDSLHVGIGSDLDGGFGSEQCPADVHSIEDLKNLSFLLAQRGYKDEDIHNVMGKNWIRFLKTNWV